MLDNLSRGFTLFMNWFNGILAVLCGAVMMLSEYIFNGNPDVFMPISIFDTFPFHDIFFTSLFWPGLALALVNGLPNVIALVLRFRGNRRASYTWGITAGIMLLIWTLVEMVYIPNPVTVFYLVLGVLQLIAGILARRTEAA